jgi:preprotein translocase subunit SecD
VQRQGIDRIAVQLPGVQNSAEVKDILGKVATLEFRLVDTSEQRRRRCSAAARRSAPSSTTTGTTNPDAAEARGHRHRRPARRRDDGRDPGRAGRVGQARRLGGEEMLRTTRAEPRRPMAVVFIEQRRETIEVGGQKVTRDIKDERSSTRRPSRACSATNFQITGLTSTEARELALLLRAGALAAPHFRRRGARGRPVAGPGEHRGGRARADDRHGAAVRVHDRLLQAFGVVANIVLLANVVLLAALLTALGRRCRCPASPASC